MSLTQEQFNQGIKNQFQEVMCDWFLMQDQNGRFMAKHAPSNVMRFNTENLVYTDSKTLEPVIKELIKVSQPLSNQTTVIKVGINDLDSQGAKERMEAVLNEVNGWYDKGVSNVKVEFDQNAMRELMVQQEDMIKRHGTSGYNFAVKVGEDKAHHLIFDPEGGRGSFESDYTKKSPLVASMIECDPSKPDVIKESFISRTLDLANKNENFKILFKNEFEAEREQPPYAFFGENRHDLGRYTLYKLTGHSQTDFVQKMQPNDYASAPDPFFVALGFAGEKGVKELILQEHLRWNANYLGEGVVYGQVKDLDGVSGRKTTPWIVSSDELWSRANAVISHPRFDKEGLEYIALTDDAKKVRDSLFWDLEWLQNLARYSPNSVERCNKDIAEFEKYAKSVLANYPHLTASVSDIRSNSMIKTENLLKKFKEGDKVMEIVKQDLEKAREQEIKAKKQSQMSGIGD